MPKGNFAFVPAHMDFELRAIALRDYRRLVFGSAESAAAPATPRNQKFFWLLREMGNIAYLGFSTAAVEFDEETQQWKWKNERRNGEVALAENHLRSVYARLMRHTNTILSELETETDGHKLMDLDEPMTRRGFLTADATRDVVAEVLGGDQGNSYPLRSSFPSLNGTYVSTDGGERTVWSVVVGEEQDEEPWWMPEFLAPDVDETIRNHRLHILRSLHQVLSRDKDLKRVEHDFERSEFGVPKISLLKIALETSRTGSERAPGAPIIFPAEVATIVKRNLDRSGIADRRVFVETFREELNRWVGVLPDEELNVELEEQFIVLGSAPAEVAEEESPTTVVAEDEDEPEMGEDGFTEPEEGEAP